MQITVNIRESRTGLWSVDMETPWHHLFVPGYVFQGVAVAAAKGFAASVGREPLINVQRYDVTQHVA